MLFCEYFTYFDLLKIKKKGQVSPKAPFFISIGQDILKKCMFEWPKKVIFFDFFEFFTNFVSLDCFKQEICQALRKKVLFPDKLLKTNSFFKWP